MSKLRPGWVGDNAFVATQFNGPTPILTGDARANLRLRYYQNQVAVISANGDIPAGELRITAYDAERHLISGEFSTSSDGSLALTQLTTGYTYFKLQLTGSFRNVPVVE